jgi:hypothetical protein
LTIENEASGCKLGEVDEKWLSESKYRIKLSYAVCEKEYVNFGKNKETNIKSKDDISM